MYGILFISIVVCLHAHLCVCMWMHTCVHMNRLQILDSSLFMKYEQISRQWQTESKIIAQHSNDSPNTNIIVRCGCTNTQPHTHMHNHIIMIIRMQCIVLRRFSYSSYCFVFVTIIAFGIGNRWIVHRRTRNCHEWFFVDLVHMLQCQLYTFCGVCASVYST